MANLKEEARWENGVYQYETTDPLQGGSDGIDNVQGRQLANRTSYLKKELEAHGADKKNPHGVTAAQVGSPTTSDFNDHKNSRANPHGVTAAQVGAYTKAEADAKIASSASADAAALVDEGMARNLLDVLGVRATPSSNPATDAEAKAVMTKIHEKLAAGDFSGLRLGDYLDLASLTADGTAYTWNAAYKNLRIHIAGLNTFKGAGDTEMTQNHALFQFRNCPFTRQMNTSNTNAGGWNSSALRTWLNGAFKTGLEAVIGVGRLMTTRRVTSTKNGNAWSTDSVFIPTEREVWGQRVWGQDNDGLSSPQWPIFRDSQLYKVKRLNGSRTWWWEASPYYNDSSSFCNVYDYGIANYYYYAAGGGGVAPAFCVA